MEIKGLPTLEWWLTKWLKDHDFKGLKARAAADFQYNNDEGTIYFALATIQDLDAKFQEFIQSNFDFPYNCDPFILSFFHEAGHAMTFEMWTDEEWDKYFETIDNLSKEEIYFYLPQEYEASRVGAQYILSHTDEIKEFWRICRKLILNIYKLNGVEI